MGNRATGLGGQGFTLIEVLAVMAIIAVLAGIVLGIAGYATGRADRSRAEADFNRVLMALNDYKAEYGIYPTFKDASILSYPFTNKTAATLKTEGCSTGLVHFLYTKPLAEKGRPFLDPKLITTESGKSYVLDPWGTPLLYYFGGVYDHTVTPLNRGREFCALLGLGPDVTRVEDDLKNW